MIRGVRRCVSKALPVQEKGVFCEAKAGRVVNNYALHMRGVGTIFASLVKKEVPRNEAEGL